MNLISPNLIASSFDVYVGFSLPPHVTPSTLFYDHPKFTSQVVTTRSFKNPHATIELNHLTPPTPQSLHVSPSADVTTFNTKSPQEKANQPCRPAIVLKNYQDLCDH